MRMFLTKRYCGYCSRKEEDVRTLRFTKNKIECLHCGKTSELIEIIPGLPYMYVERKINGRESS